MDPYLEILTIEILTSSYTASIRPDIYFEHLNNNNQIQGHFRDWLEVGMEKRLIMSSLEP